MEINLIHPTRGESEDIMGTTNTEGAHARLIASAPILFAALMQIRDGLADDQAYRECARKALKQIEEGARP